MFGWDFRLRVETFGNVGIGWIYFAHGTDINLGVQRADCHGLKVTSKKICPHPNPQNLWMLRFWKKGLTDVIKFRVFTWNYPGLSRWALNSNKSVLVRERHREIKCTEEKVMWRQSRERCGHNPKNANSYPKLEEAREEFLLEPLEGAWPLILDIWPPQPWKNKFLIC